MMQDTFSIEAEGRHVQVLEPVGDERVLTGAWGYCVGGQVSFDSPEGDPVVVPLNEGVMRIIEIKPGCNFG